jgi:3-oxoacyl-[acyl-carrier protein] reductase
MITLVGKVALISGGSRGIGAAAARLFSAAGADVAITYASDTTSAHRIVREIENSGGHGVAVRADLGSLADARKVVSRVRDEYGRIDILINNAGIWTHGKIGEMDPRTWQKTIDVNLTGTFALCNLVVPIMRKHGGGRIINISSTAGQRGEAEHSHYAASKGGVIAFTKSLAAELGRYHINVNCIAPGWVVTDMSASELRNKKNMKKVIDEIPLGYIPGPEEIAGPILFLASDLAKNITGEVLNVNGGSVLCG